VAANELIKGSLKFLLLVCFSQHNMIGTRSRVPNPVNEPVLCYLKGSPEREELQRVLQKMRSEVIEIPIIIGGKEIKTGNLGEARIPHDHKHLLAKWHKASKEEIKLAIETALKVLNFSFHRIKINIMLRSQFKQKELVIRCLFVH
jgi:hypothetical protein